MEPEFESLDRQLARLARDVVPPARLWRGIESGITRPHRDRRRIALAAMAACALLASVVLWTVWHEGGLPARLPVVAAAAPRFDEPRDARYIATRTVLEATFRERLASLDPATRTQIEASLEVIRQAHEDIRKALAAEPSNPVLEQLFESTWHEEFDLYDHVVRATQLNLTRT